MAKKRRRKPQEQHDVNVSVPMSERSVPKFEIGVKGDEFDLSYTRAATRRTAEADSLLRGLSKETRAFGFNFLNFAVLVMLILFLALSFAFLSRSGSAPSLSRTDLSGYTAGLTEYYKDTLPFGDAIRTVGAYLGFCGMPEHEEPVSDEPEPDIPDEPTPPAVTTVATPAITTTPPTTEAPTSAPMTEPTTEYVPPETHTMYAKATVNIRLLPDSEAMLLGYFNVNEKVEVIELFDDGWASILYNDVVAYVSSEYLSATPASTTKKTRAETTEPTVETTEETTTIPETIPEPEPESYTEPPETEPVTTTTQRYIDPAFSYYLEHRFTTEPPVTEPPPPEQSDSAE